MTDQQQTEKPTRLDEIQGDVIGAQFQATAWPSGLRNSSPNMLSDLWADYQANSAEAAHD